MHDDFGLLRSEFVLSFNFVIELSSFKQLHSYVKWILRLEDFM